MKNREHPNKDMILLKIKEIRTSEDLSTLGNLLLNDIEELVINNSQSPMVPGYSSDVMPIAQLKAQPIRRQNESIRSSN